MSGTLHNHKKQPEAPVVMSPRHHLTDEMLFAYAAGTLSPAFSVVVSAHLSFCSSCRERLRSHEEIGGCLLDQLKPETLSDDSFDSIMLRLQDGETGEAASNVTSLPVAPVVTNAPPSLLQYLPHDDLDNLPWKQMVPGVKHYPIGGFDEESGTLRLLHIAPGTTISEHSHSGTELTLVLKGSYTDEIGRFRRGDVADLDGETEHQPIADMSEACICLIATEGNLKFKGLLPRLIQPFIGM
ncbi:ChrR family anti-sigma-E factor [Kiloniella sp. b19]|uniref:ChrR family anti-sigma-E factor n=1 Tax=Kiloniella sp. GXU_MW_B19 TaxID=3141326 RepID=UPI0031D4F3E0